MMQRRPTTQDISWLLDLHRNNQLDLNPPYQRKSVWTRGDRQFFLDTIFRNYPSPAIFLHKTITENGTTTYHVVDGKQRTQTILDFNNDRIKVASDFGDLRLNGKKWSDIASETDLKRRFWNYQLTVELIDFEDSNLVNQVFDRLNRNARKLTDQELRHAKFGGWFIQQAESEAERAEWRTLGVVTNARSKRMADAQFISELMLVLLEGQVLGFDQDTLNNLYAKYDDVEDLEKPLDQEAFRTAFDAARTTLVALDGEGGGIIQRAARALGNIYTLWSVLTLNENLPAVEVLRARYAIFMALVEELSAQPDIGEFMRTHDTPAYQSAFKYLNNLRGANTDQRPREQRAEALLEALLRAPE
ncbi:DUF262 domain-containing protein [Mesorhizobium sp. M0678]|uniref:DUF262 domain-containing protein n=1 Tax=Mesorhizobium sp. M0678 TaxID=2956985 RepID=UPI003334E2BA